MIDLRVVKGADTFAKSGSLHIETIHSNQSSTRWTTGHGDVHCELCSIFGFLSIIERDQIKVIYQRIG